MGRIRLACRFCDRDDFDGVESIPATWFSVDETQSYDASLKEVAANEDHFAWYTHLGVCPECQETQLWPNEASEVLD